MIQAALTLLCCFNKTHYQTHAHIFPSPTIPILTLHFTPFNCMEKGDSEQEWEISKENVMPIKQGRSVRSLNHALQYDTPQKNRSLQETVK